MINVARIAKLVISPKYHCTRCEILICVRNKQDKYRRHTCTALRPISPPLNVPLSIPLAIFFSNFVIHPETMTDEDGVTL